METNELEIIKNCPCVDPCPADAIFRYIGGKWKLKVLCTLHYNEVLRYGEIKRMVKGVSPTMLANSLRELEEDGLISRRQFNEIPPHVEYSLTEMGRDLFPVFYAIMNWGFRHEKELYGNTKAD